MKYFFAITIIMLIFLAGCSPKQKALCQDVADSDTDNKDWRLAKCFEEAAISQKDLIICNSIGGEVVSEGNEKRVYSRSTCRNLVNDVLAHSTMNPKYCELIDEKVRLYTESVDTKISNSEILKSKCRDLLNN